MRRFSLNALIVLVLSSAAWCCSCIGTERPCENLRSNAAFVGTGIETTQVKRPQDKGGWKLGYSMRFAVDESLKGDLGTEVIIETGSGGGDCGTPLAPGGKFLIFAYKSEDGKLWTGLCSGNRAIGTGSSDNQLVEQYRSLVRRGTGSIFGHLSFAEPIWNQNDLEEGNDKPFGAVRVVARSPRFTVAVQADKDGLYQFDSLPPGKYTVVPDISTQMDFDHEYEDRYQVDLSAGGCAQVNFRVQPITRIKGHIARPPGVESKLIEVVAVPVHAMILNQFSGKTDFAGDDGRFDLWPLPPGDYYVGVNITSSPKADSPYPPTYWPGVTSKEAASVVHVRKGEIKELELPLQEVAATRPVHFVAVGLDKKPMKTVYVQLEDLRHPGDAFAYVNVDLNAEGAGLLQVYAGYSYHLHASHWVGSGHYWCAEPVKIEAGTEPIEARFVMSQQSASCSIEMDGKRK